MQFLHLQRFSTTFNEARQQYDRKNMVIQPAKIKFKIWDWILHPKDQGTACHFQIHRSTLHVGDDLGDGTMDGLLMEEMTCSMKNSSLE